MDIEKIKIFAGFAIGCAVKGKLSLAPEELICLYKECIEVLKVTKLRDREDLKNHLHTLMLAHISLGEEELIARRFRDAIKHLQVYLNTANVLQTNGYPGKLNCDYCYCGIGFAYMSLEEYPNALCYFEKCLDDTKKTGNKGVEMTVYGLLGECYKSLGENDKAQESLQMCLKLAESNLHGSKKAEAKAHGDLGAFYTRTEQISEAIFHLQKSLEIATEIEDKQSALKSHVFLGICYCRSKQLDKAIHHLEISQMSSKQTKGDLDSALCYGLGMCHRSKVTEKRDKALHYFEMGLERAKESQSKELEGLAYYDIGCSWVGIGNYLKAKDFLESALDIAIETKDKSQEGQCLSRLSGILCMLGQYQEALHHSKRNLEIQKQSGDKRNEAYAYGCIGSCYSALGHHEKALPYFEMQLGIMRTIRNLGGEISALDEIAECCRHLAQHSKAMHCLEAALGILKRVKDKDSVRVKADQIYTRLGACYQACGEIDKAISYHKMSLQFAVESGRKGIEGEAHSQLGNCSILCNRLLEAVQHFESFLDISKQGGDKEGEAFAYHKMALCLYLQRVFQRAEEYFRVSLQSYKEMLDQVPEQEEFRISMLGNSFLSNYRFLTWLLVYKQANVEALLMAEESRAQALTYALHSKYSCDMVRGIQKANKLQYSDIQHIVQDAPFCILILLSEIYGGCVGSCIISDQNDLVFYQAHTRELACNLNLDSYKESPFPLGFDTFMNKVIDCAYEELKAVEGIVCEDRSLHQYFIGEETGLRKEDKTMEMTRLIQEMLVRTRAEPVEDDEEDHREPVTNLHSCLEVLHEIIVRPTIDQLQHDEVVFIPDGPLFFAPYAALRDPETGRYLSETKRIRIAPSLAVLKVLSECDPDQHCKTGALVVGNPEVGDVMLQGKKITVSCLPAAQIECEAVAKILGVEPLLGSQATKKEVQKRLGSEVGVIHIASHGRASGGEIALAPCQHTASTLPTEEDYLLTPADVQEIGIRACLVVLSC